MRSGTFSYVVDARCRPAHAVELLSTFTRHSALHPLIVGVERLPDEPGVLHRYRITDRLAWGPFRFRIRYLAEVLRADPDGIETVARQAPRTTLRNSTRIVVVADDPAVTRAEVTIELSAPNALFGYAFAQARTAHAELAERMVAALEGRQPSGSGS